MLGARYLNRLPDELVELFSELESDITQDIAKRLLKANYNITSANEWQIYKMQQLGYTQKEINRLVARKLNVGTKKVGSIMKKAGIDCFNEETLLYKRAKRESVNLATTMDYKQTPNLMRIIDAGIVQTSWELQNFTRTLALNASSQYIKALDRAWLQVNTGAFTSEQAIKQAIKTIAKDGLSVVNYASGHRDKLDVAVRRAVVTGTNQTLAKMTLKRMEDMGTDLVMTSSHIGARPNHAEWQGKVFSYSGLDKRYKPFVESTGYGTVTGLCGANCRHRFFPYFDGISEEHARKYEAEENNEIYEAEQKQRHIERQIREWKRRKETMLAGGQDATLEANKVKFWQAKQREHINSYNLTRQYTRESI